MSKNILYEIPGLKFSQTDECIHSMAAKDVLMHINNHYEIYISHAEKPIYYYFESQLYRLSKSDMIITPPGIRHCSFVQPGDTLARTKIGLNFEVIKGFPGIGDILSKHDAQTYHLQIAEYQKCLQYISHMETYAQQKKKTDDCHMILEGLSLLLFILDCKAEDNTLNGVRYPRLLQDILYYIQEDNRFLTLSGNAEIANHFHVSVNYIPRLFKLYYPTSLKTLLLNLKVQHAINQLEEGATVTEACYASGFSDCSHFISTFRRITGTTPGKYKEL